MKKNRVKGFLLKRNEEKEEEAKQKQQQEKDVEMTIAEKIRLRNEQNASQ